MRVIIIKKRTLLIAAVVIAALLAGVVIALLMLPRGEAAETISQGRIEEYELNVLTGRNKELPVYSVMRTDRAIALTVDAAWEADKTDFILDTLKQYNIKATFFLCGVWVETYPDKVKAIAAAGHEIGNHSLTHPHMNSISVAEIQKEISLLDDEIERLIGSRTKLFRAPYGEYNDQVIKTVREFGYEPVQWNIDTIDWKEERSAKTILDTVLPKLSPGSIILCHNNGYKIKEYLPTLIKTAIDEGYTFVTVSELLLSGETKIDANGVQGPA